MGSWRTPLEGFTYLETHAPTVGLWRRWSGLDKDWWVFQELGGMRDGGTRDASSLTD